MNTQAPTAVRVAVLTQEQLGQLASQLPAPIVTAQTTELQAGFQLGVQHVLSILRKGFTIA